MKLVKYRIVTHRITELQVQKWLWYWPFWFDFYESFDILTIEKSKRIIEIDKKKPFKSKVVLTDI